MVHERLDKIMKQIHTDGMVNAGKLAKQFQVSVETIRRDLETLENQGALKRVYGGAISNVSKGVERQYTSRELLRTAEKQAIALRAADLIKDGDTIVMDLGTTTLEVAKCLASKQYLTCLTNSLPVGMQMVKNDSCRVFMLGGQLRKGDYSTSGFMADGGLENFRVDKAIIGASGISVKNGVMDYHVEEAKVRRKMIEISEQVILVADSSKFGASTFVQICELDSIDQIITDWRIDPKTVQDIQASQTQVIVAMPVDKQRLAARDDMVDE